MKRGCIEPVWAAIIITTAMVFSCQTEKNVITMDETPLTCEEKIMNKLDSIVIANNGDLIDSLDGTEALDSIYRHAAYKLSPELQYKNGTLYVQNSKSDSLFCKF